MQGSDIFDVWFYTSTAQHFWGSFELCSKIQPHSSYGWTFPGSACLTTIKQKYNNPSALKNYNVKLLYN